MILNKILKFKFFTSLCGTKCKVKKNTESMDVKAFYKLDIKNFTVPSPENP